MLLKLQLEPGRKLILNLTIDSTATVTDLKQAINALNKTKDPLTLHTIFKSPLKKYPDILEDNKLLSDYDIVDNCTIKYLYQKASTGSESKD